MVLVTYLSQTGHSKTYATWLSEALNADLIPFQSLKRKDVKKYRLIVFGSGVYMGRIRGIKKAKKMFVNQHALYFACGGHLNDEKEIQKLIESFFKGEEDSFYYLPGGLDYSKVKGPMKWMLTLVKTMIEKKKEKTEDELKMLDGFYHPTNFVDRIYIEPILNAIKSIQSN